jgi:penicillin-binding protein 1A
MDYMRQALKDVPAYQMRMPTDVAQIDGELYFDDRLPGEGFVASVDVKVDAAGTVMPSANPAAIPERVDAEERRRVMDLFEHS